MQTRPPTAMVFWKKCSILPGNYVTMTQVRDLLKLPEMDCTEKCRYPPSIRYVLCIYGTSLLLPMKNLQNLTFHDFNSNKTARKIYYS